MAEKLIGQAERDMLGLMDCEKSCEWCEHCLYVGDGDFWCDERHEIIASEWELDCSETCERYKEES